jgi:hypothetical protein
MAPTSPMTPEEFSRAAEAGRRMAAQQIATNPESRLRVESVYGRTYCMARYPEAYAQRGFMGLFRGRKLW